jgi:hypothetical protein
VLALAAPLLPEFLGILGVDIFLILSIMTCLFDFPVFLQYVYHIAAFLGFGQLWANNIFAFSEETRFLICVGYLIIAIANIIFINAYVGFREKKLLWTASLLLCVTVPAILLGFSATTYYVNRIDIGLPLLPVVPPETIVAILLVCGIMFAVSLAVSMFGIKLPGSSTSKKHKGGGK